ncbi:lytic transglycosylase domain-containing protein [bacterium]|nr:lytic transglycosylase domain-containing protein [bacterium]
MRNRKKIPSFRFQPVVWGIGFFLILSVSVYPEARGSRKPTPSQNSLIERAARKHNVPEKLIHSIIKAESNYNPRAVSSKGAVGLMQLMPVTAEAYGVDNLFSPKENIEGGVKYLKDLMEIYGKDLELILAAYNAGQEAIKKYGGVPPYPETVNYIRKVKSSMGQSQLKTSTKIYKFYNESGTLVLTNDRNLYLMKKKRN